jgi:uncharacterized phage protein gp47/JayE
MITIPTINQVRDQIVADIEAKIGQTIPAPPKAFFRVLATAQAGVIVLLYRFGAWLYRQIFPQTADAEALGRIGEQYGLTRKASVAAVLTAQATGINDTTIPAGTLWTREGQVYQQTAAVDIAAGVATITIAATTAGSVANIANGQTVAIASPLAGVDEAATITATTTEGEDQEELESYRLRIMQRQANRPQGGAAPDYIGWALEVAGIVKAFAYRTGVGEVTVYPLQSLTSNRIPDGSKLSEVQTYLQDTGRRPLCADVLTAAMTERIISVTVTSISPDTSAIREAVETAWESYLLRAFPVQYADEVNPTAAITLAALYAQAFASGATGIIITMSIDGTPGTIQGYTLQSSEIVKLGTVTWPV